MKAIDGGTAASTEGRGQALRMAAQAVGRTRTALGAFYRRIKGRIGVAPEPRPRRRVSPDPPP